MKQTLVALLLATLTGLTSAAPTGKTFADDPAVVDFAVDLAKRQGFQADELLAQFAQTRPNQRVLQLIEPPKSPLQRSWERYRPRFLNEQRINGGVRFWQENQAALSRAREAFGVPEEIIVAIIGVETIYGRNTGNFSALAALATLAFDYPPRAELFRRELEALFLLARDQAQPVGAYRGSYAGAIGLPQFLPSSVRSFAVDGDQDGIIDLRNNPRDAIHSVANFLAMHGWQRNEEIIRPAVVKAADTDLKPLLELGLQPSLDQALLAAYGISDPGATASKELVSLVDFVTPGEVTQYKLGLHNFYVISRYNRSSFYAMSVVELARALRLERAARSELLATAPPARKQSGKRSRR